jgi:hypothetical protein
MPIVASAAQGTEPIPTGWQFEEGAQTVVSFRHVEMGGSPAVELRTNVSIPGGIQAQLHLDHAGKVVGIIRNQTGLRLWRTAVIAGQAIQRLPDIPPGGALRVRILPWGDIHRHDYSPMPTRVYGQLPVGASGGPLEAQGSLDDRIRSALGAMPETTVFSMLGEMTFVAWTQKPLSPVLLDGSVPRRQSLTLIAKPLQVSFRHGPFELQSGTLGASLVDETPALPRYTCCSPSAQIVDIGAGGSATFEFDMPAGGQPHFSDLTLSVYGGGQDTSYTGYTDVPAGAAQAYDWRSNSWEALHFRNGEAQLVRPDRFISSTGALLLRLRVADDSHELVLTDPHKDLQVSGRGYIR